MEPLLKRPKIEPDHEYPSSTSYTDLVQYQRTPLGELRHNSGCTGDIRHNIGSTGELRHNTGGTGELRHNTGSTGDIRHNTGSTGDIRHNIGSTGELRHNTGSTGDIRHNIGSTGDIRHHDGYTGDIRHHDGYTGDIRHHDGCTGIKIEPGRDRESPSMGDGGSGTTTYHASSSRENIPTHRDRTYHDQIVHFCTFCVTPTRGTMTCFDCKIVLCKPCGDVHAEGTREFGHNVTRISSHQFCLTHSKQFVVCECTDCGVFLCALCLPNHQGHTKIDITKSGDRLQQKCELKKLGLQDRQNGENQLQLVSCKIDGLKKSQVDLAKSYNDLNDKLLQVKAKAFRCHTDMNTQLTTQIQRLEEMKMSLETLSTKKASYLDSLDKLSVSSAAEIVARYRTLPKNPDFSWNVGEAKSCFPVFEGFTDAFDLLDKVTVCLEKPKFQQETLFPSFQPLGALKMVSKFRVGETLTGVRFGLKENTVLVCTSDKSHPIVLYSVNGAKLEDIYVDDPRRCQQGFGLDTKRGLLLLPMDDGMLVTMDTTTPQETRLKISRKALAGVTYCEGPDLYIVSSLYPAPGDGVAPSSGDVKTSGSLFVVRPGTGGCVQQGPGTGGRVQQVAEGSKFLAPMFVHGYQDTSDRCLVAVSDYARDSVDLFSLEGELIHSFQGDTEKDQGGIQLTRPAGLTSDPAGRLLVCDGDRKDRGGIQLTRPAGLTSDPAGRLLVCDGDRKDQGGIQLTRPAGLTSDPAGRLLVCDGDRRVVSLWLEDGKPQYSILLGKGDLGRKKKYGSPHLIHCDRLSRQVVVGYEDGCVLVFAEKQEN